MATSSKFLGDTRAGLGPAATTFRDYLNRYKHQTRAAGLGNPLRQAPAVGDPTHDRMTAEQGDATAPPRLQVSRELGHNRLDIADTYLGHATAAKVAAWSKMLKKAIEIAVAKQQEIAEALLNWEAVELEIRKAAGSGARRTVLTPAKPTRIKHTPAAEAAEKRLKAEEFRPTWTEHRAPNSDAIGDQLEIEW